MKHSTAVNGNAIELLILRQKYYGVHFFCAVCFSAAFYSFSLCPAKNHTFEITVLYT